MKIKIFELTGDYIELIKLLKLMNLASSGAHAKMLVETGEVKLNGETELRKRAKLRKGDIVECMNLKIKIGSDSQANA
jgi:ribosome-associated protein